MFLTMNHICPNSEDHPKVNTNYEHGMKMKMKMIHGGELELTRPINKVGGKQS